MNNTLDAKKNLIHNESEKQFSQTIKSLGTKHINIAQETNNIDFHASRLFSGVTINSTFTNGNKGTNNGYYSSQAIPYNLPRSSMNQLRNSTS